MHPPVNRRVPELLLSVIASLLITTASLKLISASGATRVLDVPDPLLLLPTRYVLLISAIVELGAAVCLTSNRNRSINLALLVWLSMVFTAYRLGHAMGNFEAPGACLGSKLDWWPWLDAHQASIADGAFATFLILPALYATASRPSPPATPENPA